MCKMCSDQFVERDVAIVTQVFKYTMNVLHAAVAVQNERRCKLQTEVDCAMCINLYSLMPAVNSAAIFVLILVLVLLHQNAQSVVYVM